MSEIAIRRKTLQDLPEHIILSNDKAEVDLSQISKGTLKELSKVNTQRLGKVKTKLKALEERNLYLRRHVRRHLVHAEKSPEIKEEYQEAEEVQKYERLIASRIARELSKRENKVESKEPQLLTLEHAFMNQAKTILTPALFSLIQKAALEEIRVENEQIPLDSAEYEASVALALEAKRAVNRSTVGVEKATDQDVPDDQVTSVYTIVGGLPSLGKRR